MNKKGFTLVELLMVVIIIGILVTLAVPNYYRSVERAKAGKAKAAMDAIRKAELQYRGYHDEYVDQSGAMADLTDFDPPGDIADDGDDLDWAYDVSGSGPNAMLITATRDNGPHTGDTLTMDQDGVMANPSTIPEWGVE
jgi:prepilin-type N-terminal cleavage/methylation domain-containing protein